MTKKIKRSQWRRKIGNFFASLFIFLMIGLVVSWNFLPHFLEPKLKEYIEKKGSSAMKGSLTVGVLAIKGIWPFKVVFHQVEIKKWDESGNVLFPSVEAKLGLNSFLWNSGKIVFQLALKMEEPSVYWKFREKEQQESPAEPRKEGQILSLVELLRLDCAVDLEIVRGQSEFVWIPASDSSEIQTKKTNASPISLKLKDIKGYFHQKYLVHNQDPMDLQMQTLLEVESPVYSGRLPVSINTNDLMTSSDKIEAGLVELNLGGLTAALGGTTQLHPLEHNWLLKFHIPQLNRLSVPPQILPPGSWAGEISGAVHYAQKSSLPPYVGIQALVRGLRGDTEFKNQFFQLKGGMAADVKLDASWRKEWQFKELMVVVDLSAAQLRYRDWFQKTARDRLRIEIEAKKDGESFYINKADLEFAQLNAHLNGRLQSEKGKMSQLNFDLPRINLDGFEVYLPFLKNHPLHGSAEVKARLEGDFFHPEEIKVMVDPLQLKNVSTVVDYNNLAQGFHVGGPLSLNLNLNLRAEGVQLKSAEGSLIAELSGMSVVYKNSFRKIKGDPLSLRLKANQKGEKIQIQDLQFLHPAGSLSMQGWIAQPQKPKIFLDTQIEELSINQLAKLMPFLAPFNVQKGKLEGQTHIEGTYDWKLGIDQSPLKASGAFNLNLGQWTLPYPLRSKETQVKKERPATELHASSFLPHWPLLADSQLRFSALIKKTLWGPETLGPAELQMNYQKGVAKGDLSLKNFFLGQLKINQWQVPLLSESPLIPLRWNIDNINLNRVMTWWNPEKRDQLKGNLKSEGEGQIVWPLTASNAMQKIRFESRMEVADFFMSTLNFDQMVNAALARLKSQKSKDIIHSHGVTAQFKATIKGKKGQWNVDSLQFSTPEKNEVQLKGQWDEQFKGHLNGELRLAQNLISGSVWEANSDLQGRLVIPVEVQGDLLHPTFQIAQATLEKMLLKTLEYEKNKAFKSVEGKVKAQWDQNIEKGKEKLKKDINQKIKDLFQKK